MLIRLHDKVKRWIAPGGHIELDETPEEAAVREVKEEVGLDIVLYGEKKSDTSFYQELIPPFFMNIIHATPEHRHLHMIYFATSDTDAIRQPDNDEKTDCRWMMRDEIVSASDINPAIKEHALKALELLAW